MLLDWSPLVKLIRQHQTFLLVTHVRPDADGMGSQIALADALLALGKKVRVVIPSNLPPRYAFLNSAEIPLERFRPPGDDLRAVIATHDIDGNSDHASPVLVLQPRGRNFGQNTAFHPGDN